MIRMRSALRNKFLGSSKPQNLEDWKAYVMRMVRNAIADEGILTRVILRLVNPKPWRNDMN